MEDVSRRRVVTHSLLYFLLCGSCVLNSLVWAATQGTIGQTSNGSVSISVHIPRTVRLLANQMSNSTPDSLIKYCLSVIDTNVPSGRNYYQVNLTGKSQRLQLQNLYRLSDNDIPKCADNNVVIISSSANKNETSSTVLMLVPE